MTVSLGALKQRAQTRLDGFEARVLGSEAAVPRHLYTTEWASLSPPVGSVSVSGPVLVLGEEVLGLEGAECVDAATSRGMLTQRLGRRARLDRLSFPSLGHADFACVAGE